MLKRFLWVIPIVLVICFVTSCASTSKAPETKSNEAKAYVATDDKGTVFLYRAASEYLTNT